MSFTLLPTVTPFVVVFLVVAAVAALAGLVALVDVARTRRSGTARPVEATRPAVAGTPRRVSGHVRHA